MCKKLKSLKFPFKQLNKREFGHISERAEVARRELDEAQKWCHDRPSDTGLLLEADRAKAKVVFLDKAEKSFYYQKAKCFYVRDGVRNTKFFHNLSKRNAQCNFIVSIVKQDGSLITSSSEVLDEFVCYYRNLLGARTLCSPLDGSIYDLGHV